MSKKYFSTKKKKNKTIDIIKLLGEGQEKDYSFSVNTQYMHVQHLNGLFDHMLFLSMDFHKNNDMMLLCWQPYFDHIYHVKSNDLNIQSHMMHRRNRYHKYIHLFRYRNLLQCHCVYIEKKIELRKQKINLVVERKKEG